MKLTAAKCPNCNADIEVNETLEKAICQYCGSTILIESAIQKHQMEITGTIKVDGIQSNSEKIEIIKKHLKIGNENQAQKLLKEILDKNPFDEEALSIIIMIQTEKLKHYQSKLENSTITYKLEELNQIKKIVNNLDAETQIKILKQTANKINISIIKEHETLFNTVKKNIRTKIMDQIVKMIEEGEVHEAISFLDDLLSENTHDQDVLAIIIQVKIAFLEDAFHKLSNSNIIWDLNKTLNIIEDYNADEEINLLDEIPNHSYNSLVEKYKNLTEQINKITIRKQQIKIVIVFFSIILFALIIYFKISKV